MRIPIALAAPLVLLVQLLACGGEPPPPPEPIRPVISMVVADVASFRETTLPGRAKAADEADLAFEVPGKLVERPVNVGDALRQDQVVAKLDDRDFKNALAAAQAAQQQARAFRDRVQQAAKSGAVSRQEVTDAESRAAATEAEVRIREKALEDTTLVAPFAGTVVATYLENFQNVLAKQRVVRLVDRSTIEMEVSVPETLISLAPLAYDVQVVFDNYPDRPVPARMTEIGDEASVATRTYPVTVSLVPPEDMDIRPGMAGRVTAKADLPEGAQEVGIEVPLSALFSPPDDPEKRSFVWIVDESGPAVSKREVGVQQLTARGARIQGVEPGDRIVTVGVHHLREGQQVGLPD